MDIRIVGKIHLKLIQYENTATPLTFLASKKDSK
jgi:hypothetical protein